MVHIFGSRPYRVYIMITGEKLNEYGTLVSTHVCDTCADEFTVCPPGLGPNWANCLSKKCASYNKNRDADLFFDEDSDVDVIRVPTDQNKLQ